MKRYIQILSIVLAVPFIAIAIYISYLWVTYIDETVSDGEAYGFQIGESKFDTYEKAGSVLSHIENSRGLYIQVKVTKESEELLATRIDYSLLVQTRLHDVGFGRFSELDRWEFYFDGSFFNSITLKFCENKLCEIHRHRKYFELP
jgi:hypothetical protein